MRRNANDSGPRIRLTDGNVTLPRPARTQTFTGERMTTEKDGQIALEHFHRYFVARDLVAGKDVLDVASGEGYGSAVLASVAKRVVGVEIDPESVEHAREAYPLPNLEYLEGDAHDLPFPDASFDVVASFETLEHLRDQTKFLAEIKRVLRPGGLLLISSPDRNVYSAPGEEPNPFHVLELTAPEFSDLLGGFFAHSALYRQRTLIGSVIAGDEVNGGWRSYDRRSKDIVEATSGVARAYYLLAIASDAPLPVVPASAFTEPISIDAAIDAFDQIGDVRSEANSLREDVATLKAEIEREQGETARERAAALAARAELDELSEHLRSERAETERERAAALAARAEIDELNEHLRSERAETERERAAALAAQAHIAELGAVIEHERGEVARERSSALAARQEIDALAQEIERERAETARERDAALSAFSKVEELKVELAVTEARLREAYAEIEREREEIERERALTAHERSNALAAIARIAELEHAQRESAERLHLLESSVSWKITAPVRGFRTKFPWLTRQIRRAFKLVYWTLTGKLTARLRERRARRMPAMPQVVSSEPAAPLPPPHADAAAHIVVPASDTPLVSIVIPTYGQVDYTLRCLSSIAAAPPAVPIEVIVADDCSGDPRVPELASVRGIRLITRDANLGFLRNCNATVPLARGRYVLLLNNDTEVMPGAIDILATTLQTRAEVGLAGPKLLYPDGMLQEAGGIVWRDGTAWNYGRRDDPAKPEYNYVRETDYISGAAIMVRRADWERLGGFDEYYLPAYCEDTDLAFRLRAAGLRVLYVPQAEVVHYEGISHGRDLTSGIKAHQVTNLQKLHDRWRAELEREHFPNAQRVMRARDRSHDRRVVLVIDHYTPEPDRDAGSRSMLSLLGALVELGCVVKFFPQNRYRTPGYTDALQRMGIEVLYGPWTPSFEDWIAANGAEIDDVVLSRPTVAQELLAPLQAHCRAPIMFYGHDLHHARMRTQLAVQGATKSGLEAAAEMEALERRIWRKADVVVYLSEEEAAAVRALEPGVDVFALPGYAIEPLAVDRAQVAERRGLLFVAGFAHPPNVDAALWFVRDVLPLIDARFPGIPVALVGSKPTDEVLALHGGNIEVTGFVSDEELERRYASARVAVCPLRFGAGVKFKVIEAMQHGLPLVTTPVGAQGLPGLADVVDVTDDPSAFAAAVIALLSNEDRWRERSIAQEAYALDHFSPAAIRDVVAQALERAKNRNVAAVR